MGRGSNPYLSRKENKERKKNLNMRLCKKLRSKVSGETKMKEHRMQQQVIPHNKAIMMARVQHLRAKIRAENGGAPIKEKRKRDEVADNEPETEPEKKSTPAPETEENQIKRPKIKNFQGERWIVVSPGVVVRQSEDLESSSVGRLDHNTILDIVQQNGRRGKIVQPLEGWVSINAKDGASICQRDYSSDDDAEIDFSVASGSEPAESDCESDNSKSEEEANADSDSEDPFASLPVQRNRSKAKKLKKVQKQAGRKPRKAKKGRS